jgi:uncharacterized protein (DUF1697 family)
MKSAAAKPARYVALLRGINVTGKNTVPMKDLAEMFADSKCRNVRTYIASGNVIFEAEAKIAAQIPELITAQIAKRLGHKIPVVVRTAQEIADVAANNPFLKLKSETERLYVMFLADVPSPEKIAGLDAQRSPPDEFIVRGREIFLHLPKGVAPTKLTNAYFDAKLKTISTMRNWRTVNTLLEMMGS